jgi:hypothetical protein
VLARLLQKGLIVVSPKSVRVSDARSAYLGKAWMNVKLFSRTPFADELVQRYRVELEAGDPCRWDERVEDALRATIAACPTCGDQAAESSSSR